MNKTNISKNDQARDKIYAGVNTLADIVTITLGAKGRNVAIAYSTPAGEIYKRDIIHDGVKVARSIHLEDEHEDMGAQILREAADKTVDEVGDGTTVTILLGQQIFNQAYRAVSTGSDPVSIREGLEKARDTLIKELDKYAVPIKSKEETRHIAYISCQEKQVGDLISDAIETVGQDGIIHIEESRNNKTTIEYQTGMQLDKGFAHDYFTTVPEKGEAVLEYPYVLVTDKTISSLEPLSKLLNDLFTKHASLVIISPSFSPDALGLLLQNKMSGALPNIAINAPSFGDNQRDVLEDIAIVTGGTFISEVSGFKFEDITIDHLGKCTTVTATNKATLIVGGKGSKKDLQSRVENIKHRLEEEDDDFKTQKLRERLGKLTNGIAIIHVGGYTEIEMKERKERVDDAVHATQAAVKKGIVPGGEVVYLTIRGKLGNSMPERILHKALEMPFRKLMENAGLDSGQMLERLSNSDVEHKGIDVRDGVVKDMVKSGIIDPLLVVKSALYNSISVAIQLLLTEASIVPLQGGENHGKSK